MLNKNRRLGKRKIQKIRKLHLENIFEREKMLPVMIFGIITTLIILGFVYIEGGITGFAVFKAQDIQGENDNFTIIEISPDTNPELFYLDNGSDYVPYIYENLGGGNHLVSLKANNGNQSFLFNLSGIFLFYNNDFKAHTDFFRTEYYSGGWLNSTYNQSSLNLDVIQEQDYVILNATVRVNEDNNIEANLEFKAGYDIHPVSKLTYKIYDTLNRAGWNNQLHRVTWEVDSVNITLSEARSVLRDEERRRQYEDVLIDWSDMWEDISLSVDNNSRSLGILFYENGINGNLVIDPKLSISDNEATIGNKYTRNEKETNLSLSTEVSNAEYDIAAITDSYLWNTSDIDYKFGFNISIPDSKAGADLADGLQEIVFNITSESELEEYGNGFRFKTRDVRGVNDLVNTEEYAVYDFSDILNKFKYEVTEDSETFNVSVPFSIEINNNTALVKFNFTELNFSAGEVIELDPSISISDVNSYDSVEYNVTAEASPFSHITINDSDLLIYYSFDIENASTTVYDLTDNSNDGITGGPTWSSDGGIIGGGYAHPGSAATTNLIEPPDGVNISNEENFTILMWKKTAILTIAQRYYGEFAAVGESSLGQGSSTSTLSANLVVNGTQRTLNVASVNTLNWQHIGMSWNGSNLTLWLDGETIGSTEVGLNESGDPFSTNILIASTADPVIGARGDNNLPFNGSTDEFMHFSSALDGDVIRSIYQNTSYRFNTPASQLFRSETEGVNISQDGTLNRVNVTINSTQLFGTGIQLSLRELDINNVPTTNTSWQDIPTGTDQITTFTIDTSTHNVTLEFNFSTDASNFYTPYLQDDIVLDSYSTIYFSQFPAINSTDGNNRSDEDLNVYFIPSSSSSLNATIRWIKNDISQFAFSNEPIINDVENRFILESENTSIGEFWKAEVSIGDGTSTVVQNTSELQIDPEITINKQITTISFNSTGPYETRGISGNPTGQFKYPSITEILFRGRFSILEAENTAPTTPSSLTPDNNTFFNSTERTFTWTNSTDLEQDLISYLFEIYNDSALTEEYHINYSIVETDATTSNEVNITEEGDYYWRAAANDSRSNSTFSDLRIITIDLTLPTNFNLSSPSDATSSTDNTPELTWDSSTDTNFENYTIELSTSADFSAVTNTENSSTNSFSDWSTPLTANTYYWRISAVDKANNQRMSDNNLSFTVAASVTQTVTTRGGESSAGGGSKPFTLNIIAPKGITIKENDIVTVPLLVINPSTLNLRGISLAISSDNPDIKVSLDKTTISEINPKSNERLLLTINTGNVGVGTYGITIDASVSSPSYKDQFKIFANLLEKDLATSPEVSEQIDFAKQLFNGNPACLDLSEFITEAEIASQNGDNSKALSSYED